MRFLVLIMCLSTANIVFAQEDYSGFGWFPVIDETNSDVNCTDKEFACKDGSGCIRPAMYCDGWKQCRDGSDEIPRLLPLNSSETGIPCRQGDNICLLPKNQQSKRNVLCTKDVSCTDKEFACKDGSGCIRPAMYCDGLKQCRDGSDEIPRLLPLNSSETGIPCRQGDNICLLPKNQHSKRNVLCTKDTVCTDEEFECEDGSGCLAPSHFCDRSKHCNDGSDEKYLLQRELANDDIMCEVISKWDGRTRTCGLHKKYQCDGSSFCKRDVDECLCGDGDSTYFLDHACFRCLSHPYKVIPIAKLCNGILDCPDLSDECLCKNSFSRPEVCNLIFDTTEGVHENVGLSFLCDSGNKMSRVEENQICDGQYDCNNKVDELSCSVSDGLTGIQPRDYQCFFGRHVVKCDGKPECMADKKEECDCDEIPAFCRYISDTGWFGCKVGGSNDRIYGYQICDGRNDCDDKEDELFCTNRTHYYCHDDPKSYVLAEGVCDQKVDCADGSDELNCEENFRCSEKVTSGSENLYVHKNQVCDGISDCAGDADECLSVCIQSSFSSILSLIKNKGVLGVLYIISSIALCGNIFVFIMTMREMLCPSRRRKLQMLPTQMRKKKIISNVLILSLAISDALVAIYTMAICIKTSLTEGRYCVVDQDWRSGGGCSVLGTFLLIGSEQSVFTLIIITIFRLYTIWRPDGSVSVRKFGILIALTWFISICLGVIPLLPHLEDTFTTSIWFKDNQLFSTIRQKDVNTFTYWLLLMHISSNKSHSDIGSWSTLEGLIRELNPNFTASRRYGFYSSHAVCIPDFFPEPANTASWWYSLLLIILNFIGFLVIAIGYFLIYGQATKKKQARDSEMQSELSLNMQKRLTVISIIATDFFCWIPVCIMAFLQLSGVAMADDLRFVVGMILIPINSVLNPMIYFGMLPVLLKKFKQFFKIITNCCIEQVIRHITARPAGDIELLGGNGGEADQPTQRVLEETMAPVKIHALDSAAEEGQIVIKETTSV